MDKKTNALSVSAVIVVSAYIAAQMIADIASLKIGVVAGLSVDMGTFIYPITFTLRDLAHRALGKRNVRILIFCAAAANLAMALYMFFASSVQGDEQWGLSSEFAAVMSPVWRIVLASILAELISELLDMEVYHTFVHKVTKRHKWLRVLVSNSVSVPVDNAVFAVAAFAPFGGLLKGLPWGVVGEIFVINLAVKYGITLLSLPLIYLIKEDVDEPGGA